MKGEMTLQHFLMFNWKSLLYIVDAAVLFVQDGGILYVKTIGKEVLYGVIKFA